MSERKEKPRNPGTGTARAGCPSEAFQHCLCATELLRSTEQSHPRLLLGKARGFAVPPRDTNQQGEGGAASQAPSSMQANPFALRKQSLPEFGCPCGTGARERTLSSPSPLRESEPSLPGLANRHVAGTPCESLPEARRNPFLFIYFYFKPVQFVHGPSDQPPGVGVIIASSQPACWRLSRCCFVCLSFHMNAKILNHVKHSLLPPLPPKLTKAEK